MQTSQAGDSPPAQPGDRKSRWLRGHPLLPFGGAVLTALAAVNGLNSFALNFGVVVSLGASIGVLVVGLVIAVIYGLRQASEKGRLLKRQGELERERDMLKDLVPGPPVAHSQVRELALRRIDRITLFHECAYVERREITYWIEADEKDRIDVTYFTRPAEQKGNWVHWHRIRFATRGNVPPFASFEDLGFDVRAQADTEVLLFPTLETRGLVEGAVFFLPPISEELEWRVSLHWEGLWNDLRTAPDYRGEGILKGSEKQQCRITHVQTDFVFPLGATDLVLNVESDLPKGAQTTRDGRPTIRWLVENPRERHPYTLAAKLPARLAQRGN